jgi:AcrR family transcriptional regulator
VRTADPARVQRIIDSAAQMFSRRHYHEVRMDDIAAQAGVAKGTLYLHFKDKEDLYLALLLNGVQRLFDDVQRRVAGQRTPEEKLRAFVRETVQFFERYPYFLELAERVEASGPAARVSPLRATRERFLNLLAGVLEEFDGVAGYAVEDPALAALALAGMTREILRFHPRPWGKRLPEWIVAQFLHGFHRLAEAET